MRSQSQQPLRGQVNNGAVTAGELAYGGRVRALEATVDTLEATIRGQEQALSQLRLQRDKLMEKLRHQEESTARWLAAVAGLRRRFQSALSVLQVAWPCRGPSSGLRVASLDLLTC